MLTQKINRSSEGMCHEFCENLIKGARIFVESSEGERVFVESAKGTYLKRLRTTVVDNYKVFTFHMFNIHFYNEIFQIMKTKHPHKHLLV